VHWCGGSSYAPTPPLGERTPPRLGTFAAVHRALQAGIVGTGERGAESIVVSGGYEDDEDHGSMVIYTGRGGQHEDTKKQITD
jgi:SAD/SRA domain